MEEKNILKAIKLISNGQDLTFELANSSMDEIMRGDVTPAQFGSFIMGLKMKGETSTEIAGLATGMREKSLKVELDEPLLDTCGTGGEGLKTFNISTAVAFVVAGAGVKVAKHGNRAISGSSGSADVLEEMGVKITLSPYSVKKCIEDIGIGFIFDQSFHPAMKFASPLDEVSIEGNTTIWQVSGDSVKRRRARISDFGLPESNLNNLVVDSISQSAETIKNIFSGDGADPLDKSSIASRRNAVIINSASALVAAGKTSSFHDAAEMAKTSIDSGAAQSKLLELVNLSNKMD